MPILKVYDGSGWVEIPILDGVPGGELGGTWASPTVDATHSGSAHHAQAHGPSDHTEGGNWKLPYTDGSGDEQELALSATGGILESKGASSAPVFTIPKRSIIIRAGGLVPNTTNPCADAVQTEEGTGGKNYVTRSFATNEQGSMEMALPENYDGGTVTWWYYWISPTGSSANDTVEMGLRGSSSQNGDAIAEAQGTQIKISDTLLTGAGRVHKSGESAALTIAGSPSGGDPVIWELERTAGDGSDMAEEIAIWMVYIRYPTNNSSDE